MYKIFGADLKEYGPVGAEELRQWIAEGRANAHSQIQVQGSTEWRPLGTFSEFAADLGTPALRTPGPLPVMAMSSNASAKTSGFALAGFILGLASIPGVCCCCFGPLCSIVGLIFSCMGLSQINRNPMLGGKGLAIAGIILSILGFLISAGCIVFGMIGAATDPTFLQ